MPPDERPGPRSATPAHYTEAVAAPTPAPGGGSVAAWVGALGAALAQMTAGLTAGRPRYAAVDTEMRGAVHRAAALRAQLAALADRDEAGYAALVAARAQPGAPDAAAYAAGVQAALREATEAPLATARTTADVATLAATLAERGNRNAAADAAMGALLAAAACRGSACNVRVNAAALTEPGLGPAMAQEAAALAAAAAAAAARAVDAAERGA